MPHARRFVALRAGWVPVVPLGLHDERCGSLFLRDPFAYAACHDPSNLFQGRGHDALGPGGVRVFRLAADRNLDHLDPLRHELHGCHVAAVGLAALAHAPGTPKTVAQLCRCGPALGHAGDADGVFNVVPGDVR